MQFEKFNYTSLKSIKLKTQEFGVNLPLSKNINVLKEPLQIGSKVLNNRIAIQPMEGCDGTFDGRPDDLTFRRYNRFAKSGAGLIWAEATAIVPEGRANPRQLMINNDNLSDIQRLVDNIKETSMRENGFSPMIICQLAHSGRYSKPQGIPAPLIAYHNYIFEEKHPISDDRLVSDDYLESLEEIYGKSAQLAQKAGFDGADIKCCHRYLLSELLSAHKREGRYGGSFGHRTRLLRHAVKNAQDATSNGFIITSRLNLYDGFPYPNGFGVDDTGSPLPNLTESIKLVDILHNELKVPLLNFTIGNPYFNPHVNRPYDNGEYIPPEHPLEGVSRMFLCIGAVSEKFPKLKVISSGHSYLREFSPYLAAGAIEMGISDIAGFGREAFAYPEFPNEIFKNGRMEHKKCCISCGKCTELMRSGKVAGCVVRDSEIYLPIYKEKNL
ncbi:MAG: flavin oxidoreductase/NADH oxidase [Oscillospiraceae bacterium]